MIALGLTFISEARGNFIILKPLGCVQSWEHIPQRLKWIPLIRIDMKAEELTCTTCNDQLDTAFLGKAEARDWDTSELVCSDHFDAGSHLVPKE
jgi:hypothetical protein